MPKHQNLRLGFSSCPNDTFIFDAMIHQKIDTEGLSFQTVIGDVEELNQKAFHGELDITKLSFHAFGHCIEKYALLDSGAALGRGVGPLLIAREHLTKSAIQQGTVAIPGEFTTAHLLFNLAYPNTVKKREYLFSDIESAVLSGEVDSGLIIHENRFTYAAKGLVKLIDLGEFWENKTGLPIPLGGIVVKRDMDSALQQKINRVLRRSLEYAYAHPDDVLPFIKEYAQEMDQTIVQQHIDLYVNDFSLSLGTEGQQAVQTLFSIATQVGIFREKKVELFAFINDE